MGLCSNRFLHFYTSFHSLGQVSLPLQINKAILFRVKRSNIQKMPARIRAQRITQGQKEAKRAGTTYRISAVDRQKLLNDAKYFKGGRYVWGGTTPEGFDCSGYVQYLYKKHDINLPRTAWQQSKIGQIVEKNNLQKGDLLFFLTDKKRGIPITHVGIYIGNGNFIHAASKKQGIIISPITHGSYAETFVSARRVTPQTYALR
jgi:cell wall-associated NlpC family hydrolase